MSIGNFLLPPELEEVLEVVSEKGQQRTNSESVLPTKMPSYLNVLPWLLHGSNRYEFQKYVDNYDHEVSGWTSGDLTLFLR